MISRSDFKTRITYTLSLYPKQKFVAREIFEDLTAPLSSLLKSDPMQVQTPRTAADGTHNPIRYAWLHPQRAFYLQLTGSTSASASRYLRLYKQRKAWWPTSSESERESSTHIGPGPGPASPVSITGPPSPRWDSGWVPVITLLCVTHQSSSFTLSTVPMIPTQLSPVNASV